MNAAQTLSLHLYPYSVTHFSSPVSKAVFTFLCMCMRTLNSVGIPALYESILIVKCQLSCVTLRLGSSSTLHRCSGWNRMSELHAVNPVEFAALFDTVMQQAALIGRL